MRPFARLTWRPEVDSASSRPAAPRHATQLRFTMTSVSISPCATSAKKVSPSTWIPRTLAADSRPCSIRADVWIQSPSRALDSGPRRRDPRPPNRKLIITSITSFGLTGPYRDYHVTDAVLVALSGLPFRSGAPDKPPLSPPGALTSDIASTTAAFATVMALYNRSILDAAILLDVSIKEAAAADFYW